jgi:hypothetical protein
MHLTSDFSKTVIKMSAGTDSRHGTALADRKPPLQFVPRTSAVTEVAMLSLRHLAVGVLIVSCVAVGTADAAPILYLYTGTASADPDIQAFIPPGSPATILLTVDPGRNNVAGNPLFPPNVGQYSFTAVLDFTGREYTLGGVFEINEDLLGRLPQPGQVDLVELSMQGPPLIAAIPPIPPGFSQPAPGCGFTSGAGVCRYDFGMSDPTSPALPFFPVVSFPMSFLFGVDATQFPPQSQLERVTISGSNPQVVPEPSTLLLFGTGMALVVRTIRRRLRSALPD